MKIKNKRGAMEMTVGTMVTIVLLVAVLVMILYFISRITESGTSAIENIDSAIRAEIDKIFAQNENKLIVVYPTSREITIKKGDERLLGFGFLLRNKGEEDTFSYDISAESTDCSLTLTDAEKLIAVGKDGDIVVPAASVMQDPIYIKFRIPETAPECIIRYNVDVKKAGSSYVSSAVDLIIKSA